MFRKHFRTKNFRKLIRCLSNSRWSFPTCQFHPFLHIIPTHWSMLPPRYSAHPSLHITSTHSSKSLPPTGPCYLHPILLFTLFCLLKFCVEELDGYARMWLSCQTQVPDQFVCICLWTFTRTSHPTDSNARQLYSVASFSMTLNCYGQMYFQSPRSQISMRQKLMILRCHFIQKVGIIYLKII